MSVLGNPDLRTTVPSPITWNCISFPCTQAQLLPASLHSQEQSGWKYTNRLSRKPTNKTLQNHAIHQGGNGVRVTFLANKKKKKKNLKFNFQNSTFQHIHPSTHIFRTSCSIHFWELLPFQRRQDHDALRITQCLNCRMRRTWLTSPWVRWEEHWNHQLPQWLLELRWNPGKGCIGHRELFTIYHLGSSIL